MRYNIHFLCIILTALSIENNVHAAQHEEPTHIQASAQQIVSTVPHEIPALKNLVTEKIMSYPDRLQIVREDLEKYHATTNLNISPYYYKEIPAKLIHNSLHRLMPTITLGLPGKVISMTFDLKERTVITGSLDGIGRIWDISTGQLLHALKGSSPIFSVAINFDGTRACTRSYQQVVHVWDIQTEKLEKTLIPQYAGYHTVDALACSPKENVLVAGPIAVGLTVWNIENGQLIRTLKGIADPDGCSLTYSSCGNYIVAGIMHNQRAAIWNLQTGKLKHILNNSSHARATRSTFASLHSIRSPHDTFEWALSSETNEYKIYPLIPSFTEIKDIEKLVFLLRAASDWEQGHPHVADPNNPMYQKLIKEFSILKHQRLFTLVSTSSASSSSSSSSSASSPV